MYICYEMETKTETWTGMAFVIDWLTVVSISHIEWIGPSPSHKYTIKFFRQEIEIKIKKKRVKLNTMLHL